ncbi:MAG: hypothetical protein ACRDOS_06675 [Gaiellaceae bacterium]
MEARGGPGNTIGRYSAFEPESGVVSPSPTSTAPEAHRSVRGPVKRASAESSDSY